MGKMVVNGIVITLVIAAVLAVAAVVITGSSLFDSLYNEQDLRVENIVREAVALYQEDGQNTFSSINGMYTDDPNYPFVVDSDTLELVAHGANPDLVGSISQSVTASDRLTEEVLEDLQDGYGTWVKYKFINPHTGDEESKITFLYMYDKYIFGAGYYVPP